VWHYDKVATHGIDQIEQRIPETAASGSASAPEPWTAPRAARERLAANLAQEVADDLADRATPATMPHSMFRCDSGAYRSGSQIVEALLKDAEPATAGMPPKTRDLLRLDRNLLEIYAVHGYRNIANYRAERAAGPMSKASEEIAAYAARIRR